MPPCIFSSPFTASSLISPSIGHPPHRILTASGPTEWFDPDHSESEDRFIMLGMSAVLRILVVCHCYRADDETIRIISARKATRNECSTYERRT